MTKAERARQLVKAFPKVYPNAHCELEFKTPLQLLVATILSAQCTDKRVNLVTPALFHDMHVYAVRCRFRTSGRPMRPA